jgi:diphthamide biosynthesis methyltransferase
MKTTVTTDRWFRELPLTDKVIEHIGVIKVVTTKYGFTEYRFDLTTTIATDSDEWISY